MRQVIAGVLIGLIVVVSGCATNDPVEPKIGINARNGEVTGAVSKGPVTVTSDGRFGIRLGPVSIYR